MRLPLRARKPNHSAWLFLLVVPSVVGTLMFGNEYNRTAPYVRQGTELASTGVKARAQILEQGRPVSISRHKSLPETMGYDFRTATNPVSIRWRPVPTGTMGLRSVGGKIDVWYDPKDPVRCTTEFERAYWERRNSIDFHATVISAAVALVAGTALSWSFANWRRRNGPESPEVANRAIR